MSQQRVNYDGMRQDLVYSIEKNDKEEIALLQKLRAGFERDRPNHGAGSESMRLIDQAVSIIDSRIEKEREEIRDKDRLVEITRNIERYAHEFSFTGTAKHLSHDVQSGLRKTGEKIERYSHYPR